jgi:hypothetical protein
MRASATSVPELSTTAIVIASSFFRAYATAASTIRLAISYVNILASLSFLDVLDFKSNLYYSIA